MLYNKKRRKIKRLPIGKHRYKVNEVVIQPNIYSRHFPANGMYILVAHWPLPYRDYDER